MNNQEKKSITSEVLDKIKSGDIKMKSRLYFCLKIFLLALGVLILSFFIVYIVSFIIFSLRSSGILFLPSFGSPGMKIFLKSLPWVLILVAAILIILLEMFTKHLTFVYRRPIIYSLLVIIFFSLLFGFMIEKTPFHSGFFMLSKEDRLPLFGPMYRDFGAPKLNNVHYGMILEITDDGFIIETPRNEEITIIINSETKIKIDSDFKENDMIVVMGDRSGDVVEAVEIHKTERNNNLFPSDRMINRPSIPR